MSVPARITHPTVMLFIGMKVPTSCEPMTTSPALSFSMCQSSWSMRETLIFFMSTWRVKQEGGGERESEGEEVHMCV
jgi:hypothetical protein